MKLGNSNRAVRQFWLITTITSALFLVAMAAAAEKTLPTVVLPVLPVAYQAETTTSVPAVLSEYPLRTWTNTKGKTIEGKFVKLEDGKVFIETKTGGNKDYKLEIFSAADQEYVKTHTEKREWTAKSGHKTAGQLVDFKDGKVYIKKTSDGKTIAVAIELLVDANQAFVQKNSPPTSTPKPDIFAQLFAKQKSDVQVSGNGVVTRILSDDNDGDKHQRFIVKLASGQTLLIAHNIDIAPRIEPIAVGDSVEFYGEYYYSKQGGGVHWTHHSPNGKHVDGYIKANGKKYQ